MLLAVTMLLTIGLACIYSTGKTFFFHKQIYLIGAGIAAFIAVNLFHYRRLGQLSYTIYGASLLMLIFVLIGKYMQWDIVPQRNWAYRWIEIPHLPQFQPSEFAKLAYILALAWYLKHRKNYRKIKGLIQNPRPLGSEKLSIQERYRVRQGDYRIVYSVDDKLEKVEIVRIGHRREVYRK